MVGHAAKEKVDYGKACGGSNRIVYSFLLDGVRPICGQEAKEFAPNLRHLYGFEGSLAPRCLLEGFARIHRGMDLFLEV